MVRGRPPRLMHRLLVPTLGPGRCPVPEEEAHHLSVRRARDGEAVEVMDGAGGVGQGTLRREGRDWLADVTTIDRAPAPPPLVLLLAAGDRDRFGWAVEKAVELGATRIVPVETERSVHVATRIRAEHRDKLVRRAAEALKQCGGTWLAAVDRPQSLSQALGIEAEIRWLADAAGAPSALPDGTGSVAVLVGPEGGLTDAERDAALGAGFRPVRLGPRILRFETAAVAALAAAALGRKEP
ncbi:MAG: 16S rRNA (uracil(1498)-N(3))-methyltransferase [Gemmatimonadales bacterium]